MNCFIICAKICLCTCIFIIWSDCLWIINISINELQCKIFNCKIFSVSIWQQIFINSCTICTSPETECHIISCLFFVIFKISVINVNCLSIKYLILPFAYRSNNFIICCCNGIFEITVSSFSMKCKICSIFKHWLSLTLHTINIYL